MQPTGRVVTGCPLAPAALLPRGTGSRTHSAAEGPDDGEPNVSLSANIPVHPHQRLRRRDVASSQPTKDRRRGGVESGVLPSETAEGSL